MNKETVARYERKTRASKNIWKDALSIFSGGQSHNSRYFEPYPFFARKAQGKYLWDVDGNKYVDYWMGHTALILGHSPSVVSSEIRRQSVNGLLLGTPNVFAYELGKLVTSCVPCAELVRFCTSGAEATMYATRLARAFTGRNTIVKMEGGWHGYGSSLTVGVSQPYNVSESKGLVSGEEKLVRLAKFNDVEQTRKIIRQSEKDIAAVIVEPVLGAGGTIPAKADYLKSLKEECERIGAILIFDEIITGFRLALGGAQEYYGIKPDLCTLGKILGGGLPASAIVGREDIMALTDTTTKSKTQRCWIGGGTFSEHALSMCAGLATLNYLKSNRESVYPSLEKMGKYLREGIDGALSKHGFSTETTGAGSLFATHFLKNGHEGLEMRKGAGRYDKDSESEFFLSLIAEGGIFLLPGHIGAISTKHTKRDLDDFLKACEQIGSKMSR